MTRARTASRFVAKFLRVFYKLLYHELAWSYDLVAASVSIGMWVDWVKAVIPYLEGRSVLEIGFGPGHLQVALSQSCPIVIGIDASSQMALQTRRRLTNRQLKPNLALSYAQSLPFADRTFDQIVSTFPAEFIFDPSTTAEAYRVLKPNGTFIILPFAWITGSGVLDRLAGGVFRFTGQAPQWDEQLIVPLQNSGFDVKFEMNKLSGSEVIIIIARRQSKV